MTQKGSVNTSMFGICYYLQILNSVIGRISVYVVNHLAFLQIATEMLFQNKAMFKDTIMAISIRVVSAQNLYITILNTSTASPVRIFATKLVSFHTYMLPRNRNFKQQGAFQCHF